MDVQSVKYETKQKNAAISPTVQRKLDLYRWHRLKNLRTSSILILFGQKQRRSKEKACHEKTPPPRAAIGGFYRGDGICC